MIMKDNLFSNQVPRKQGIKSTEKQGIIGMDEPEKKKHYQGVCTE